MPRVPEPHCPEPGCPNRGTCREHHYRSRSAKKYNRRDWRELSKRIRRDRPTCETDGCDQPSEHVDHIDGDENNDAEWNLQALCNPCHSIKGHLAGELHRPQRDLSGPYGTTDVTLVAGPPGSGKSTYVHDHAQRGDLIVDYDLIFRAISGLDTHDRPPELRGHVLDARDAILSRLEIRPGEVERAWIIHAAPKAEQRASFRARYNARTIVILTPPDVCRARFEQRPSNDDWAGGWEQHLETWWRDYELSPSDHVVRMQEQAPADA